VVPLAEPGPPDEQAANSNPASAIDPHAAGANNRFMVCSFPADDRFHVVSGAVARRDALCPDYRAGAATTAGP
jgi:hypothetical protein